MRLAGAESSFEGISSTDFQLAPVHFIFLGNIEDIKVGTAESAIGRLSLSRR